MHYARWKTTGDPLKTKLRQTQVFFRNGQCLIDVAGGGSGICDPEDAEFLRQYEWRRDKDGYLKTQIDGKNVSMHVLLFGRGADHKNRCPWDNRRSNFRKCTTKQNSYNRGPCKNNQLGLKGVYFHNGRNRFRAHIRFNGKRTDIGEFATAREAANAYDERARQLFGEFAFTNFPVAS